VWAEQNTRESIFSALERKEVFATSGPRIRVRFFGGWGFTETNLADDDLVRVGYERGAPMGGDLPDRAQWDGPPSFMIWAARDPNSAPLQRLQVVKGWIEDGAVHEMVYDVACSDGAVPDPTTTRCPENGATVDLSDCSIPDDLGDSEIAALWSDPDFDPAERGFYYLRVLENPRCRWSTWDALRLGVEPPEAVTATIQERALSSPIWYSPAGG
jgi:hypothetical protein